MTTRFPPHPLTKSPTRYGGREARSTKAVENRIIQKPPNHGKAISTPTMKSTNSSHITSSNNARKLTSGSMSHGGINPPFATDSKETATRVQQSSTKETKPTSSMQYTFTNSGFILSAGKPLYPEKHPDKIDDLFYLDSAQGSKYSTSPQQNGYDKTSATKMHTMSHDKVKSPTSSTPFFAGNHTRSPDINDVTTNLQSRANITHPPSNPSHAFDKKLSSRTTPMGHDIITGISQVSIKSDYKGKDERLIHKPTRGLKNLGNTCFMNCILQCLSHTLPLRDFFLLDEYKEHLKTKGDLSFAFKCAMSELWIPSSTIDSYAPHDLKRRVGIVAPRFSGYNQHDAQEFMRFLLNELHEEINKADVKGRLSPGDNETLKEACQRYLTWENSVISELFSGMLRSEVCCSVCRHRSIVYDPFMDLALPIPKSKFTSSRPYIYHSISYDTPTQPAVKLDACMQVFTKEETLDEEERPYCNKCQNMTKSTKQLSIAKLPKFLVIQLKRFSGYSVRSKLSTPVEFEERWEICDNSGKTHAYSLYGIACHSGGIYGGHYTAYCKHNKQWRYFNDNYAVAKNWDSVKCQEAYILFYEKIDDN